MKKTNVLITGGAGFIGSHLCERLVTDKSCNVYSLDNYFTGSEENHVPGVTYIRGSTKDIASLIKFRPDIIYHLGEYSRVEQSFDDVELVWQQNTAGTFAVLEFVRKTGCKILYAGSSTKFGDGGNGSDSSPYAWTKSSNTELVMNYSKWFNIDYAITYFYNVYGKREITNGKYATLIGLFTEKMKNGETLTIVRPGHQERNFTHIDDIIDGLVIIGKNGVGDGYGIGAPKSYTVLDVAKLFGGSITMVSERAGNRITADLKTEKTEGLGWKPTRSLKNYINNLKANNWSNDEI